MNVSALIIAFVVLIFMTVYGAWLLRAGLDIRHGAKEDGDIEGVKTGWLAASVGGAIVFFSVFIAILAFFEKVIDPEPSQTYSPAIFTDRGPAPSAEEHRFRPRMFGAARQG